MSSYKNIANELAAENDADIILVNSGMERGKESDFIDACTAVQPRQNAIVLIVTNGGDADVAYRIARCLQQRYTKVTGVISGLCKSAGTLLAIGAHDLAFSEHGELGPLDVQLRKADDIWANVSGLTVMNAFSALQQKSHEAFTDFALKIKVRSGGSVTFKTAAEMATKLTVGLFSHIYQQIEVMHVGEAARAMNIAKEYGQRLDGVTDNLEPAALGKLIASYPSHEFVIDQKEAATLFRRVRGLTAKEDALCKALGRLARREEESIGPVIYLSDPPQNSAQASANDPNEAHRADQAGEAQGAGPAAVAAAQEPAAPQSADVVQLVPPGNAATAAGS